jgi:translation initiation factor 2 subunit 2
MSIEDIQKATAQMYDFDYIVNKKLEEFVSKFVMCRQCNRPDTNVQELGHGLKQLICESCGARTPIR